MNKKVFGFKEQMKVGDKGEKFFIKCYHKLNPRKSTTREVDIVINDNEKVEIKCDSYKMDKTPNMFLEKEGSNITGKLGGAHRAVQDNLDWFVYLYISDRTFYWFRPNDLKKFIDKNKDLPERKVFNRGYHSTGVLIDRKLVKDIAVRIDKF